MQVTLEVPDAVAMKLPQEPEQIATILMRGLRGMWSASAGAGREVIEFLASGPSPADIVRYKPSAALAERSGLLLDKNSTGSLSNDEASELDELAQLDSLVAILKAEARKQLKDAA